MWPYSTRGSRAGTRAPAPQDMPPFNEFRQNNASMKVWLPQRLSDRIGSLSLRHSVSRSDVKRALMFEHLYGRVAYEELIAYVKEEQSEKILGRGRVAVETKHAGGAWTAGDFAESASAGDVLLSTARLSDEEWDKQMKETDEMMAEPAPVVTRASIDLKFIGKSTENVKLDLPARMKGDLEVVAAQHDLSPSSYVRKMFVQQLLGELLHTDWQAALGAISVDWERLERDA